MNDVIYEIRKEDPSFNLRVPPSCLLDYKGYRCLANLDSGIGGDITLQHGPNSKGEYIFNDRISW